jgi:hypothetical protein
VSNPYGSGSAPTPDGPPRVAPPIEDYAQPYSFQETPDPGIPDQGPIPQPDPARGQRLTRLYLLVAILSSVLLIAFLAMLVWLD